MQRLIIYILINRSCILHIFLYSFFSPVWPVMRLKNYISLIAKKILSFKYIVCPCLSITYLSTSKSINIMHSSRAIFSHPKTFILREICVHFHRRFRSGGQMKAYFKPVYNQSIIALNLYCRCQKTDCPCGLTESYTYCHTIFFTGFHRRPVLILSSSSHSRSAVNVFTHSVFQETFGG